MDFLQWQYLENPAGKAGIVLAKENETGALVGEIARIPSCFHLFGKEVTATYLVNSLIRKDYRNIALFYELHAESLNSSGDSAFVFGVPNPFSYPLFSRLFSCRTVTQIPLMLLPVRPKALVRQKVSPALAKLIPDIRYKGIRHPISKKIEVSRLAPEEMSLFDGFWEKIKDKYPVMGVRRSRQMTWRYGTVPTREYRILAAKEGADLLGYAVTRENTLDGIRTGFLVDFLVLPGRRDAATALLRRCVESLVQNGADLIGALMLPHCEEYRFLTYNGFVRCPEKFIPQPFPLIIRQNEGQEDGRLWDPKSFFFTMGDYDAV
jgi:hypothetical protein